MRWLAALVLVAITAIAAGTRLSDAAFTAQRSNPANQFTAAASFERMRVASGTYTGNGSDGRDIGGLGFVPDLVIVKGNTGQTAVARTATMSGDRSKPLGGTTAISANMIQALQPGGFEIGTNARVNSSGIAYTWIAFDAAEGTMNVAAYLGNGQASQSLSGLGYSPEFAIILGENASAAVMRSAPMSTSFRFDTGAGIANAITSLNADGGTVGNNTSTNSNGVLYHVVTWNEVPGVTDVGSYTGNGSSARSITSLGLAPDYAIVRSTGASSRAAVHRPAAMSGTGSLDFTSSANDTNAITGLLADGFQVGNNANANAGGNPYAFMAFEDESP